MKNENLFFIAVGLIIGILITVIFYEVGSKPRRGASPASQAASAPPSAPPQQVVNYDQNIKMLKDVIAREPENRDAWVKLGHNYFDSNQYVQAVEAYDKALEMNRNDPNVLTDQGIMFRRLGWYDRAVKNFKEANKLSPTHHQSLFNLGLVYREDIQDFKSAIDAWERYVQVAPAGPAKENVRKQVEFMKSHPQTGAN